MTARSPIVGGNWKMNTDRAGAVALARAVAAGVRPLAGVQTVVFPPFVYLSEVAAALAQSGGGASLGAQDCYHAEKGAFTGEISVGMLKDCGAAWVLAGHSERRHVMHEGDDLVNLKLRAALHAGLSVILCVGEKLEQRLTGQTDTVNERQVRLGLRSVEPSELARIVIAYEPVWAIGTGKTATPQDAQDAHRHIRSVVADMFGTPAANALRIQYGGSVTAANAQGLMAQPDIDGALVGGASLKADEFTAICAAAANAR
ncbi:MAG: triose-phosphate isomerase [Phycisphaeraceae bacterium]|nr:triose-phosphate isomerase [Phycisphaeraceae bacterium]